MTAPMLPPPLQGEQVPRTFPVGAPFPNGYAGHNTATIEGR